MKDLVVITDDNNPIKRSLMENIVLSINTNQLGYVDGKDPETGEVVPLLVGIDRSEEGMQLFPIARVFLDPNEMKRFLVPDENGNFTDHTEDNRGPDEDSPKEE